MIIVVQSQVRSLLNTILFFLFLYQNYATFSAVFAAILLSLSCRFSIVHVAASPSFLPFSTSLYFGYVLFFSFLLNCELFVLFCVFLFAENTLFWVYICIYIYIYIFCCVCLVFGVWLLRKCGKIKGNSFFFSLIWLSISLIYIHIYIYIYIYVFHIIMNNNYI